MLMMMKAPQNIRESKGETASVSGRLLSLLVCPLTRAGLIYDAKAMRLISLQAGKPGQILSEDPQHPHSLTQNAP